VEVLGMMHFLHYYGTEPAEGADGDGDAEDPVVELIEGTFTRLCADERTPAIVRATALSVIGLLGTLLPAPCLASWLDAYVPCVRVRVRCACSVRCVGGVCVCGDCSMYGCGVCGVRAFTPFPVRTGTWSSCLGS
jgi:hypothetical protein